MTLQINGKKIEWKDNETITQLLKRVGYVFPLVIFKLNGEVIPRNKFSQVTVPDNAEIDVIHMISGG
jgi:thiamine biosynthesis protein ThiS